MANVKFSAIAAAATPALTDTVIGVQGGTTDVQYTFTQLRTLLLSGAAGGSLKGTYPNPGLADVNTVATSLAIGGAAIGTDALGVTGTATISGSVSSSNAAGWRLVSGAASATAPTVVPNLASPTTGIGAQAAGNISLIVGGAESWRFTNTALTGISNSSTIFFRNGTAALFSPAAATFQLGGSDAAAPVAQTLRVQSVVAGTSNTAGANWTIAGSVGTGTGAGGSLIFQTAPAGSTGSAQNALVTALTIDSTSKATFAGEVDGASFVPTGTTVPAAGFYSTSAGAIGFSTGSTLRYTLTAGGNIIAQSASGVQLTPGAASATAPSVIPNRSDSTTGIGAQASGNISLIVGAAEQARVVSTGLTIISGKALVLGNAATTGLTPGVLSASTNASIVITDSTGQAYRIPCII